MNRHPKIIINALAAAAACFIALGLSSCTTEEMEASLSYSPTSVSVGSTGGSFEIAMSATIGYSVSVSGEWLTLSSGGSELYELSDGEFFCRVPGSVVLGFTAEANTSSSTRIATITLSAGDITKSILVTQAGISLSVSPTTVSVAAAGGTFSITVTSNVSSYSASCSASWLTLDSSSGDVYTYTAYKNTSTYSRMGTITVTAGAVSAMVTVTQAEADESGDDDSSGTINGYEYVDLGLSVKWATCNIGADSPEDYGNYYAWGETETKDTYTSSNSVTYEVYRSDFSGNAEYDAATDNWGSPWRMPTSSEIGELVSDCTWTWTTLNDVNGYEVTGTNGNSIFLPAAGFRSSSSLYGAGYNGRYWSSTPYSSSTNDAYNLHFSSGSVNRSYLDRYYGYSVRPVSE